MSRQWSRRRTSGWVALAAGVAALVAACAPGGSSAGSQSSTPTAVSTSLGSAKVSLTLYDGQGLSTLDKALIAGFEKQYPNVTITGRYDPDNVTTQNDPRVMASANPPDLIRVIAVGDAQKSGLLVNLDPYAQAYGWDKLPASQLSQFRAANGVAGSGSLYAKPSGFTMTGLYYNKKQAAQIGMTSPPSSVSALTALLAKAKAAGLVPIMDNGEDGGVVFPYQLMLNSAMGPGKVAPWVFDAPGASIVNSQSLAAATQLSSWFKAGYFPSGVNGINGTTAAADFIHGQGVFFPSGNWEVSTLDTSMPGNVGFIPMPPMTAGGTYAAMSDAATSFGIPVKSTHHAAAAAFLNWLSSDAARQIVVDNGFLPSGTASQPAPTVKQGSVYNDVLAAFNKVAADGGQVPFVQNATTGIANQAWIPYSQELAAGKISPQQFLADVQNEYKTELSS